MSTNAIHSLNSAVWVRENMKNINKKPEATDGKEQVEITQISEYYCLQRGQIIVPLYWYNIYYITGEMTVITFNFSK